MLKICSIKNLVIMYQEMNSEQEISLIELLNDKEMELLDFLENKEMSGELINYIKYSDGTEQVVTHDKSEPDLSEGTFRLFDFAQRWLTVYEWRDSKEFETRREFLKFDSLYEGLRYLAGPEKWSYYSNLSSEELEEHLGPDTQGLDEHENSDEHLEIYLRSEKDYLFEGEWNSRKGIKSGRYYDPYLEKWINIPESYTALRPFILGVTY